MGIYVITGASSGIGAKTLEVLREKGNEVINVDIQGGDINANLATNEGRNAVIKELHDRYPDGIDGIICNAGVNNNIPLIISLNYFGVTTIVTGIFDLLVKKKGSVVVTCSNSIGQGNARMDIVSLLNNNAEEERILEIVKDADPRTAHSYYTASKYAIARWVRRASAEAAARGVRINAVAPGNVRTAMTDKLTPQQMEFVKALPVPLNYGTDDPLMDPVDIANAFAFLVSPEAHGICGVILFVDSGTDALLNADKVC